MVFSQPNKNRSNENNLKFGQNTSNQIWDYKILKCKLKVQVTKSNSLLNFHN